MNLPDLTVNHFLSIVLKRIKDHDCKLDNKIKRATIDLSEKAGAEKDEKEVKEEKKEKKEKGEKEEKEEKDLSNTATTNKLVDDSFELVEDPIEEVESNDDARAPANLEAPIPKKPVKSSTYSKCETLLRFLWTAAWQLRFPSGNEQIGRIRKQTALSGILVALTTDLSHLEWGKERHTCNGVGQQQTPAAGTPVAPNHQPAAPGSQETMHLARKTTSALESMSACFQVMQTNGGASSTPLEKVHSINMRMIKRLCSVDGTTE
jgi:hypothetical protein